jgi:FKBP-type peptidyl-prolyl cis-trans isomerase
MKFIKFLFIAAIAAPMFLTSCGSKAQSGYSLSFDVPDSVAYQYGLSDAARLQVQSLDLDEFSKAVKKAFKFDEEDKAEVDSAQAAVQRFSVAYNNEINARMAVDSTYQPEPIDLPSDVSYSLGILVGNSFTESPLAKMNINDYLDGVKAYFVDITNFDPAKSQQVLNEYFAATDSLRIATNERYLADNKEKKGVITTTSGLQYEVLTEGTGDKPSATDQVKVNYKGTFVDGKTFDSSYDRGEPVTFPLNGVIPGWTEGVGLMSVGSKYRFVIPFNLAYGERGNQAIPGKSTLVFEVELLEILPPAPAAPQQPQMTEEEIRKMLQEAQEGN